MGKVGWVEENAKVQMEQEQDERFMIERKKSRRRCDKMETM